MKNKEPVFVMVNLQVVEMGMGAIQKLKRIKEIIDKPDAEYRLQEIREVLKDDELQ